MLAAMTSELIRRKSWARMYAMTITLLTDSQGKDG